MAASAGRSLPYDIAFRYAPTQNDPRLLPRLPVAVRFFAGQPVPIFLTPLVDTGAEISVFDGNAAVESGWSMDAIIRQGLDVRPISGLGRAERSINGYLHDITCYIVSGAKFAELSLRALITPPNTLKFPVLGFPRGWPVGRTSG